MIGISKKTPAQIEEDKRKAQRRVAERRKPARELSAEEKRKDKRRRVVATVVVSFLWTAMALVGWFLVSTELDSYAQAKERLTRQAQVYSKMMAAHDRYDIAMAEMLIKSLMARMDDEHFNGDIQGPRRDEFQAIMREHWSRMKGLGAMSVVGADGMRRFGMAGPNINLGYRPYFQYLKDGKNALYVGPAEEGLSTPEKEGIHVAIPHKRPDGSFGGLILINLSIRANFQPYYASLDLKEGAKLQLRSAKKLLIAFPEEPTKVEDERAMVKEVGFLIDRGINRGVGSIELSGETWIMALERIPDTAIFAQAGLSETVALGGYRREAMLLMLAMSAAIFASWAATRSIWRSVEDQAKLAGAYEHMRELATRDKLTGLPNRAYLAENFAPWRDRIIAKGEQAALVFVDLDHFKSINDTLGHGAGDDLLKQVAGRLSRAVKGHGWVCRLGGDEFVIAIELGAQGVDLAKKICEAALADMKKPFKLGDNKISSGASMGVARIPVDGKDWEEISRKADVAMYGAKASGRGAYGIYDPSMEDARGLDKLEEHSMLVHALAHGGFHLDYQPMIGSDGSVGDFEALLRWTRPDGRVAHALEFMAAVESHGLAAQVADLVFDMACKATVELAKRGLTCRVWVNVGAVQMNQGDLVGAISKALEANGADGLMLGIEIKEAALLAARANPLGKISALRAMGLRVALDDFGTGYSSLAALRDFPIDLVKLDASFAKDISGSSGPLALAVIQMSKALGVASLAEGVETREQWAAYLAMGCAHAQGHLWGRALSLDKALALAENPKNRAEGMAAKEGSLEI